MEAANLCRLLANDRRGLLPDLVIDVTESRAIAPGVGGDGLGLHLLDFGPREPAFLMHAIEHMVACLASPFGMADRLEIVRAFDDAGNGGAFLDGKVPCVLAEVALGRRLDAVELPSEEDAVQVQFENLRF